VRSASDNNDRGGRGAAAAPHGVRFDASGRLGRCADRRGPWRGNREVRFAFSTVSVESVPEHLTDFVFDEYTKNFARYHEAGNPKNKVYLPIDVHKAWGYPAKLEQILRPA
jgi:hypothetical protein